VVAEIYNKMMTATNDYLQNGQIKRDEIHKKAVWL